METYTEYLGAQIIRYINTIKDTFNIKAEYIINLVGTSATSSSYIKSELDPTTGQEIKKEYTRNRYTARYEVTQTSPVINFTRQTLFTILKGTSTDFSNNLINLFDLVKNALNVNINFENLIIDIQETKIIITMTMVFK